MIDKSIKRHKLKSLIDKKETIKSFIVSLIDSAIIDAVLLPIKVPSGDSFAWILIKDKKILNNAEVIAPIMPINVANALKQYTRKGKGNLKIAVLLRPCEVRATIELIKLNQINSENVILMSYDCIGAIPMKDYIADPVNGDSTFNNALNQIEWNSSKMKEVCHICEDFSNTTSDLHFAFDSKEVIALANSKKGEKVLENFNENDNYNLEKWQKEITKISQERARKKEDSFEISKKMLDGLDAIHATFANCIGCHNCGSVCPICYCRQCYFDSSTSKPNSDIIIGRAESRGGISLPLDKIMYHTGRMAHMSLSCVSCGVCSDACPVNIPVAKLFSYVATQTQKAFEYSSGESLGDTLPMKEYKLDEMGELAKLVKSAETLESENE